MKPSEADVVENLSPNTPFIHASPSSEQTTIHGLARCEDETDIDNGLSSKVVSRP
jgi:hypothetical protein